MRAHLRRRSPVGLHDDVVEEDVVDREADFQDVAVEPDHRRGGVRDQEHEAAEHLRSIARSGLEHMWYSSS